MKIISNVRDYYDSAVQYSDDVVYRRKPESTVLTGNKLKSIWSKINTGSSTYPHIIGFCGKLYPVCVISSKVYYPFREQDVEAVRHIYDKMCEDRRSVYGPDASYISEFLRATGNIKDKKRRCSWHGKTGSYEVTSSHEPFIELGSPSFFLYEADRPEGTGLELLGTNETYSGLDYDYNHRVNIVTTNPVLSQFGFVKVVDPYTACQEIEMYLGRLAHNEDPKMPVGNDKVMAESKGYDKWSFRKMPTKHQPV